MGVQIDLIIPPLIVGLLVIVIFRLNAFIMETSVDNQINNDMQTFAEVTSRVIQEQVKMADEIVRPGYSAFPDSVLKFVSVTTDTITVQRAGKNLAIIRTSSTTPVIQDTLLYPSSLLSLEFELERKPPTESTPYYLNMRIQTESDPTHHASTRDLEKTVMGFSESEIYLRNVHRNSLP